MDDRDGYMGFRAAWTFACALNLCLQHNSYVPPHSCWRPLWSSQNHAGSQPMEGVTICRGCWSLRIKPVKLFGCWKITRPPTPAATPNENVTIILMCALVPLSSDVEVHQPDRGGGTILLDIIEQAGTEQSSLSDLSM